MPLRIICLAVILALAPLAAEATMPVLDEMPRVRTDQACWAWAGQQIYHEDVAAMWGVLDDGNYDPAVSRVGLQRPSPSNVSRQKLVSPILRCSASCRRML